MKRSGIILGLIGVIVLTVGGGLIQGKLSHRWGQPADMTSAAKLLASVPDQVGSWQLRSTEELDPSAQEMLQCAGHVVRTYADTNSGAIVHVTMLIGPAGPTSEHTPEICFSTQNYQVLGPRKLTKLQDAAEQDHAVWNVDFQSRDVVPHVAHTYYAWSTGHEWMAPENPRFEFVASPYLYKIQLVETGPPGTSAAAPHTSVVPEFLQVFLPAVADALRPAEESSDRN